MTGRGKVPRSAAGFTVMELLTALTLAAIVGSIGTPVASRLYDHYRFQNTTRQVGFEISRARWQAIGQNAWVRIRFLEGKEYVRERSMDGVNYVQEGNKTSLPSSTTAYTVGTIAFNRQGLADAGSWVVLIDNAAGRYSVLYSNVLGRVTTNLGGW
ncbi:MAG: Tfp pilus assembly protein FimT/FimU [Candidatus Binatia bacterium]